MVHAEPHRGRDGGPHGERERGSSGNSPRWTGTHFGGVRRGRAHRYGIGLSGTRGVLTPYTALSWSDGPAPGHAGCSLPGRPSGSNGPMNRGGVTSLPRTRSCSEATSAGRRLKGKSGAGQTPAPRASSGLKPEPSYSSPAPPIPPRARLRSRSRPSLQPSRSATLGASTARRHRNPNRYRTLTGRSACSAPSTSPARSAPAARAP